MGMGSGDWRCLLVEEDKEKGEGRGTYEGAEEEVVVVGGGGVVEEGRMTGVAGVFEEKVFGRGVFFCGLCNGACSVSTSLRGGNLVTIIGSTYDPSIGSACRQGIAGIVAKRSRSLQD